MVSKATFEALALPHADGNYFLRPDRILGAFLLDPAQPPSGYDEAAGALEAERDHDKKTKAWLRATQDQQSENEETVNRALRMAPTDAGVTDVEAPPTSSPTGTPFTASSLPVEVPAKMSVGAAIARSAGTSL